MRICLHVMAGVVELLINLDRKRHSTRLEEVEGDSSSNAVLMIEREAAAVYMTHMFASSTHNNYIPKCDTNTYIHIHIQIHIYMHTMVKP